MDFNLLKFIRRTKYKLFSKTKKNQKNNEKTILYVLVADTLFSNGIFADHSKN